jgi:glycerophosphoryl diester phosphodiesterase
MSNQLSIPGKKPPYLMAHRGNRAACPENTRASFRRAIEEGADILETDLHLSADGEFMCIHDATVDRTTDGKGAVAEMTLAQLKQLSASYGKPGFEAERILTLAELAALLPPDVALALELKTDRFLELQVVKDLVCQLDKAGIRERSIVLSFSLARIQAVHDYAADIPMGWINLSRAAPLKGPQLLGPFWPLLVLNPFFTWLAHRRGQYVAPLDTTPEGRVWYYRLLGCDAILTDDPGKTAQKMPNKKKN